MHQIVYFEHVSNYLVFVPVSVAPPGRAYGSDLGECIARFEPEGFLWTPWLQLCCRFEALRKHGVAAKIVPEA